jgi:transposase
MSQLVPVKHEHTRRTNRRVVRQRDHHAIEERRMRAADLFEHDVIPAEIARRVGVAHQVVSEWRKAWRQGGREALRSAGPAGRKSKLSTEQLAQFEHALVNGAAANGYQTDVWTLPRVAEVIQNLTGVSYHPGHVWYVLRDQLDWTCQRPALRAIERNYAAIERWVRGVAQYQSPVDRTARV